MAIFWRLGQGGPYQASGIGQSISNIPDERLVIVNSA
jgi:hypothetical protein